MIKLIKNIPYDALLVGSKGLLMRGLTATAEGDVGEYYLVRVMRNNILEREWFIETVA